MWIKTRVGLVSIPDTAEIVVQQNPKDGRWSVFARVKVAAETHRTGIFGTRRRSVRNPSSHLAVFSDRPDVSEAIGECMAKIEAAIRAKAEVCDLSESGDADAWGRGWRQILWPKTGV